MYWFRFGTVDEYQISEHMGNIFSAFGNLISGNKKLYGYSGNRRFVRMGRSNPSNLELWMYQVSVVLKCGLSLPTYSKMQLSSLEDNVRMKAADIVKDWVNLIINHIVLNKNVLYMDSYYLTKESSDRCVGSDYLFYCGIGERLPSLD